MRTVKNIETVTIKVSSDELIEGKWLHYQLLSKKLNGMEQENRMTYKSFRNKLYNCFTLGKYNTETKADLKCIDIENPMKIETASLILKFERV